MSSLKIIFAGTPDFAARHLQQVLTHTQYEVLAVYTQPDRKSGRGQKHTPSPVKTLAMQHAIPVYQPQTLKTDHAQQQLASLGADLMVVVAYGLILPHAVLQIPKLGCINVHGSLLPKWRGAAPIQRAVCAGDVESGVTIMQMDTGLDTGPMLLKRSCALQPDETSASLYDKLAEIGPCALTDALQALENNQLTAIPQDHTQATLAPKLTKEESFINWHHTAQHIERQIRGFNPWPVARFQSKHMSIKIWHALVLNNPHNSPAGEILAATHTGLDIATGDGVLRLTRLQLPGKKQMSVQDILNGHPDLFQVGDLLTTSTDVCHTNVRP